MTGRSRAETTLGRWANFGTAASRTGLLAALLVVGTVLAYLPVWHAGVIWDDRGFIMDNPLIRRADGLWQFWFSTAPVDFYPVTWTMWWLEWRMWGGTPLGYHAVNVLLHALGAVLLWRLLARLKVPGAWLAAAIFAVHPVNVESVAWIAERKNVLAMLFYLASLYCYVRYQWPAVPAASAARPGASSSPVSSAESSPSPSRRWYGLALLAFLMALLSKTVVAPLPFVLLALVAWQRGKIKRADVLSVLPFLALAVAIGAISFWFQSHRAIGADVVRADSFWGRLAGAGWAIWFYAYKALLPFGLRSLYPRWQIDSARWWSYLPALLVGMALAAFWRARATWGRGPLWALVYFIVMLLPVLGFLNIGFMKFSLVADHWQYFAIIGPVVLCAAAIAMGYQRLGRSYRYGVTAGLSAMLVGLALLTSRQCELYRNSGTFWEAALAAYSHSPHSPDSWAAHNNLGGFLVEQGQLDEAIGHFRRAVEFRPDYAKARYNLGAALREKGQVAEAMVHLRRAVDIQPDYVEAHNSLARALASSGQWDRAREHLERSLELDANQAETHNNLANVLWHAGLLQEAAGEYEKALALRPDYSAAHFNLGEVLRAAKELRGAVVHYRSTLEITPDFIPALDRLAWVLATSPDASVRDGVQAVALAIRAEQLSAGRNPEILATLAAAYAEVGRFEEAVATGELALRAATSRGRAEQAERLRTQLARYQTGAPYRDVGGTP